jgi:hypothetical protein
MVSAVHRAGPPQTVMYSHHSVQMTQHDRWCVSRSRGGTISTVQAMPAQCTIIGELLGQQAGTCVRTLQHSLSLRSLVMASSNSCAAAQSHTQ